MASERQMNSPQDGHLTHLRKGPFDPQNLVKIRWLALFGQLSACIIIYFGLGFEFPFITSLGVIFTSALVNLAIDQRNRHVKKVMPIEVSLALSFDVLQLTALIYLTGGLLNPFFILLLAPLIVSAAILELKATISLLLLVILSATFLSVYHLPLPWAGAEFVVPQLFLFGILAALIISSIFIAFYTWYLADNRRQLALLLSRAQLRLADEKEAMSLGHLATAAAHKLGSPLNTIYLISHELMDELSEDDSLFEDLQLLNHEVERCRIILSELDHDANQTGDDLAFALPARQVIQSLIHTKIMDMDKQVFILVDDSDEAEEPVMQSYPELKYALETILDNADGFARDQITITISWNDTDLQITIQDDGAGFTRSILNRFGQPFNSTRKGQSGHKGLGLYLSISLIETMGGLMDVKNTPEGGGYVAITLPRTYIEGRRVSEI